MHELQVQTSLREKRDFLPELRGGQQEFDHRTIEYHLAYAKRLRDAELRRLARSMCRRIMRAFRMKQRKLPSHLVVRA